MVSLRDDWIFWVDTWVDPYGTVGSGYVFVGAARCGRPVQAVCVSQPVRRPAVAI